VSALADSVPHIRAMFEADLPSVMQIEGAIYSHPWTRGNFADSIKAGYTCQVMEAGGEIIGYGVLMLAAQEAHILNVSVAKSSQRNGYGRTLVLHFIDAARLYGASQILLEVRLSNVAGRGLYASMGFQSVTVRPGYYPAMHGREDAILMGLAL
jgi:ribosomal-protein-alanine N-acetyltransferase